MIKLRPESKNYYIRLYNGGKEKKISLRTSSRKIAMQRAGRIKYQLYPAILKQSMELPEMEIAEVWDEYVDTAQGEQLQQTSKESKLLIWKAFIKWLNRNRPSIKTINAIDRYVASDYLSGLAKGHASGTHNRHKSNLSSIWQSLMVPAGLAENPWRFIQSRSSKVDHYRAFTDDEVKRLLDYLADKEPFWTKFTRIGLYTGLRLKDIVFLQRSKIQDDVIRTGLFKTVRTEKKVYIPIHREIQSILNEEGRGDYYFPDEVAVYLADRTEHSHKFTQILKKARIFRCDKGKVGFHSLRATFITNCDRKGISRRIIQGIVGHGSPLLTEQYSDDEESAHEIKKLPPPVKKLSA